MSRRLGIAVGVAALLWCYMFSPWTAGMSNFWLNMSLSALILSCMALAWSPGLPQVEKPLLQLAGGILLALLLWGIFWVGDKAAAWLFPFARGEVNSIYAMKTGVPPWVIALLLLLLIGPAEEFFWRGYVQRSLERVFERKRRGRDRAFVITALVYALVHVWSLNFMLVMAALVAGGVWGLIYRFNPRALPALIVSHALWDALVFVWLPI